MKYSLFSGASKSHEWALRNQDFSYKKDLSNTENYPWIEPVTYKESVIYRVLLYYVEDDP